MKKLLNLLLLVTFQFGYLEWGSPRNKKHMFIYQAEAEVFSHARHNVVEVLHPLIIIPLLGMLLLLYTFFSKSPDRIVSLTGTLSLSVFMALLFFIGVSIPDFKILVSTIPFLVVMLLALRFYLKKVE
jgi:peptidoglycan/LPS O-acetylase OafA/YrhL